MDDYMELRILADACLSDSNFDKLPKQVKAAATIIRIIDNDRKAMVAEIHQLETEARVEVDSWMGPVAARLKRLRDNDYEPVEHLPLKLKNENEEDPYWVAVEDRDGQG